MRDPEIIIFATTDTRPRPALGASLQSHGWTFAVLSFKKETAHTSHVVSFNVRAEMHLSRRTDAVAAISQVPFLKSISESQP